MPIVINGRLVTEEQLATLDGVELAILCDVTRQAIHQHRKCLGIPSIRQVKIEQAKGHALELAKAGNFHTVKEIVEHLGSGHRAAIYTALRANGFIAEHQSTVRSRIAEAAGKQRSAKRERRYTAVATLIRDGATPEEAAQAVGYSPKWFRQNHMPEIRKMGLLK